MKKRVQQVAMISCIGPQADTQKVFSSKLLHEHSRDIPDKEWKMEFIRNRNNEAEYNPCITNRSSFQSLYYDEHQWKTVYSTQLYHGMEFFFCIHTMDKIIRYWFQKPRLGADMEQIVVGTLPFLR